MLDRYDYIVSELNRYSEGIHILNAGTEEATIEQFEEKSGMCLPSSYKSWLKIHNGGELIAFDLRRTTLEDGCVVQFDVESGQIIDEWNCFSQWLDSVLAEGQELFDYEGNEK